MIETFGGSTIAARVVVLTRLQDTAVRRCARVPRTAKRADRLAWGQVTADAMMVEVGVTGAKNLDGLCGSRRDSRDRSRCGATVVRERRRARVRVRVGGEGDAW